MNKNYLSSSDLLLFQKRQILAKEFRDKQTRNGFCCSGIKKTVDTGYVMDLKIGKNQYSGPCCDTKKSCSDKNNNCARDKLPNVYQRCSCVKEE